MPSDAEPNSDAGLRPVGDGRLRSMDGRAPSRKDDLVKRSDEKTDGPPAPGDVPNESGDPTIAEVASVLSEEAMQDYLNIRKLNYRCNGLRNKIRKFKLKYPTPDAEQQAEMENMKAALDVLKPFAAEYGRKQRAVKRLLLKSDTVRPQIQEKAKLSKERSNRRAKASYSRKTEDERAETLARSTARRRAARSARTELAARVQAGHASPAERQQWQQEQKASRLDRDEGIAARDEIMRRIEVLNELVEQGAATADEERELTELESKKQLPKDVWASRWAAMTDAERDAYRATSRDRVNQYYDALKIRLESLRARIEARLGRGTHRRQFDEIQRKILRSSKKSKQGPKRRKPQQPQQQQQQQDTPNTNDPTTNAASKDVANPSAGGATPAIERPRTDPSTGQPLPWSRNPLLSQASRLWRHLRSQQQPIRRRPGWLPTLPPARNVRPPFEIIPWRVLLPE
ncbi:MAG: hypothetical protein M1826_004787 [Phylliscum demangeonii]|nr:MAG: hypothetical protein M1826_004787 [Phylliscum demangeonii]